MEMTKAALRDICVQHKLYRTPHLNDKLYCNFKGFAHVANLEEYTELKALFLEGNALSSLEGMPQLHQLKCLYLQSNALESLQGLHKTPNLDSINVSSNLLTTLYGLDACAAQLNSIIAEGNQLEDLEGLAPLAACHELHTLDLQRNRIADPAFLDLLRALPQLRCLYLRGNPVVSAVPNYRKTLIAALPALTYLDDRPVFEEERRCCAAWALGGVEAEREERMRYKEAAAATTRRNFEFMQELRKASFQKRRAMMGLPPADTDPMMDTMSDEEYQLPEEGEELRRARLALGTYLEGGTDSTYDDMGSAASATDRGGARMPAVMTQIGQSLPDRNVQEAGTFVDDVRDAVQYLACVREAQRSLDALGSAMAAEGEAATAAGADAASMPVMNTHADQLASAAAASAEAAVQVEPTWGSDGSAPGTPQHAYSELHAARAVRTQQSEDRQPPLPPVEASLVTPLDVVLLVEEGGGRSQSSCTAVQKEEVCEGLKPVCSLFELD